STHRVSEWTYLPAGGGSETMDSNRHRITKPARILAISIRDFPPTATVSAFQGPNVSSPSVVRCEYAHGFGLRQDRSHRHTPGRISLPSARSPLGRSAA